MMEMSNKLFSLQTFSQEFSNTKYLNLIVKSLEVILKTFVIERYFSYKLFNHLYKNMHCKETQYIII